VGDRTNSSVSHTHRHRQHLQRPLLGRTRPSRHQPRPTPHNRNDQYDDHRTRIGQNEPTIECANRVHAGKRGWSRLGSNQRPSACEAAKIAFDLQFICFCASHAAHGTRLTYSVGPAIGHRPDAVLALPTRDFLAGASSRMSSVGARGQAPRNPASHHRSPTRHPRRAGKQRHHNKQRVGWPTMWPQPWTAEAASTRGR
jgi:hypothetical protein